METERGVHKMELNTKDELLSFLTDLQGQITNLQQIVDQLVPVEEVKEDEVKEEVITEEELSELDALLQEK